MMEGDQEMVSKNRRMAFGGGTLLDRAFFGDRLLCIVAISLLLSLFFFFGGIGRAAPAFPEDTGEPVIDPGRLAKEEEKQALRDYIVSNRLPVKVVIVGETAPLSTKDFAERLFAEYGMSDEQLLLVLAWREKTLAAHPGKDWVDAGIDGNVIESKISYYFLPYAAEGSLMQGTKMFLQQTVEERRQLQGRAAKGETEGKTPVTEKGREEDGTMMTFSNLQLLIEAILLVLFAVFVFGVYGMFRRSRVIREIDEAEAWKEALNEQVSQLPVRGKLKEVTGTTKEKIESLLQKMQEIVQVRLPEVEERLVDAEELGDRFRFKAAYRLIRQVQGQLAEIETAVQGIEKTLHGIEEKKRENEILIKDTQKFLDMSERKLDELRFTHGYPFHELKKRLADCLQMIASLADEERFRDTLKANEWLRLVSQKTLKLKQEIEGIPHMRKEIEEKLPQELKQFEQDIASFYAEGYRTNEPVLEEIAAKAREKAERLKESFAEGMLETLERESNQIREMLDAAYQTMEEEVTAKAEVQVLLETIPSRLEALRRDQEALRRELEELALRYEIEDTEMIQACGRIGEECETLLENLQAVKASIRDESSLWVEARESLASLAGKVQELESKRQEMNETLQEMRKEELAAREQLDQARRKFVHAKQQLMRSMLPGIPEHVQNGETIVREALDEVEEQLSKTPLDLSQVQYLLGKAQKQADSFVVTVEGMIETCREAESLIQYGNRYRRKYRKVDELLSRAEAAFRHLDYEEALQLAQEAVALAEGNGSKKFFRKKESETA
ncbi:hypothetical protein BSNK01_27620 [Bacillaceae bacterium]